jgi:hypothetical protein
MSERYEQSAGNWCGRMALYSITAWETWDQVRCRIRGTKNAAPVDKSLSTQQSKKKEMAWRATSGVGVQMDHRSCNCAKDQRSRVPKCWVKDPGRIPIVVSTHRANCQQNGTGPSATLDSFKDDQRVRSGVIQRPRLSPSVPWWIISFPGTWITSRWQSMTSSKRLICRTKRWSSGEVDEPLDII